MWVLPEIFDLIELELLISNFNYESQRYPRPIIQTVTCRARARAEFRIFDRHSIKVEPNRVNACSTAKDRIWFFNSAKYLFNP